MKIAEVNPSIFFCNDGTTESISAILSAVAEEKCRALPGIFI